MCAPALSHSIPSTARDVRPHTPHGSGTVLRARAGFCVGRVAFMSSTDGSRMSHMPQASPAAHAASQCTHAELEKIPDSALAARVAAVVRPGGLRQRSGLWRWATSHVSRTPTRCPHLRAGTQHPHLGPHLRPRLRVRPRSHPLSLIRAAPAPPCPVRPAPPHPTARLPTHRPTCQHGHVHVSEYIRVHQSQ